MQNHLGVSEINVHLFLCHLVTKNSFFFFWSSAGTIMEEREQKSENVRRPRLKGWVWESSLNWWGLLRADQDHGTEADRPMTLLFAFVGSRKKTQRQKSNDLLWLLFLLWTRFLPTASVSIFITSNRIVSIKTLLELQGIPKSCVFRSARTSCRTFDVPSRPPVRNNFSWAHRWAETLPSGLRDPSNPLQDSIVANF